GVALLFNLGAALEVYKLTALGHELLFALLLQLFGATLELHGFRLETTLLSEVPLAEVAAFPARADFRGEEGDAAAVIGVRHPVVVFIGPTPGAQDLPAITLDDDAAAAPVPTIPAPQGSNLHDGSRFVEVQSEQGHSHANRNSG